MILRKIGKVIERIQKWIQREKVWKTVRYQYLISPSVAVFFGLLTSIIDVQGYAPEELFADDEDPVAMSDESVILPPEHSQMVYVVTKPIVTTLVQTTTTESQTTTTTTTTVETTTVKVTTTTEAVEEEPEVEYVVYKPRTKYVHRSTCHWVDDTCYEISSTDDIEARLCDECWPDIEIINEYVESDDDVVPSVDFDNNGSFTSLLYISEEERIMLAKLVWGEAGSDWILIYDKACVVACAWTRYCEGGWQDKGEANTVSNVITASGQFYGYSPDNPTPQSCVEAVEYYFENMEIFPAIHSFSGDGTCNYFN